MRIHQLPPNIANQIAAGEVIERPASVVKELLENSLDAKASNIFIELSFGGLNKIKISDDGVGIFAEDLPLAISAHATSKITKIADLYNIKSMGFRGEALASISSVSRLTISSRPKSQKHAMMLTINELGVNLSPCARNIGTTITVEDIFFNTPVRKKFLKTERGEFQACENVVLKFALSAPGVALSLKHNDKLILNLPAATCAKSRNLRIKKIFGIKFIDNSSVIDVKHLGVSLRGLIGLANLDRSQRDKQWIYVNNRMVRDKLLAHAVMQAYQDVINHGRFPLCLLYLDIDPSEVDVNVHPTKHEVRFQNPRMIHDFLVSSITDKLTVDKADGIKSSEVFSLEFQELKYVKSIAPQNNLEKYCSYDDLGARKILNDAFALIFFKQKEPYLVDLAGVQQHYSNKILENEAYPLATRPLLVPISYQIAKNQYAIFEKLMEQMLNFGIQYDFISEASIMIRTIPKCLPLLDIKLLFSQVNLNLLDSDKLRKLIVASQSFDALQSTEDEQTILVQYLEQHNLFSKFCVHLNNSKCESLFKNV